MNYMIKFFNQITKFDVATAGGKGASLGEMVQAGLPVPPGFVVTPEAFEADGSLIDEPAVLKAFDDLNAQRVAVRSSGTAEDATNASWAGQFETFLNVGRRDLISQIKACWNSANSDRVKAYLKEQKLDPAAMRMAVVVQAMVNSDIAGVMFTVNPVTRNRDELMIEAIYGLGDLLVGGEATPESLVVNAASKKITSRNFHGQTKMLVYQNGNKTVSIPKSKIGQPILSDAQARDLTELGQKIEHHYGQPMDIEWAIAANQFYILQARPITTLDGATGPNEIPDATVLLRGIGASQGIASGPVKVVSKLSDLGKVQDGDVLVAIQTTPEYVEVFGKVRGIITEIGGITSHAGVVARELSLPAVVNIASATTSLHDGDIVTVDGFNGVIYQGQVEARADVVTTSVPKPFESTGNDIDDLINVMTASLIDARELWPLAPGQLFGYVDLDQSLDMHAKLKQLIDSGLSIKEIAQLFHRPATGRYFLLCSGVLGLKFAHEFKVGHVTIKEQTELVQWMIDIIRSLVQTDPLCLTGKNLFWDQTKMEKFVGATQWQKPDDSLKRAVNLLAVNLFTLNWSFYWDYFPAAGYELHGPYQSQKFPGSEIIIRDFYNLRPTEIWPVAEDMPYKSILIGQVYHDANIFVTFGNRIINRTDLNQYNTDLAVLVDGQPVTDVTEITKLAEQAAVLARRQTDYVNALAPLDQVRRGAMLAYYLHKDFYLHFSDQWYPEATVEAAIKLLGDKFVKIKLTADRSLEMQRQMFDPRNYIVPS